MALDKVSPALKEILLKLYRAEKAMEIDQHIYEFGSVEYYIEASASEPHHAYLSISTSLISPGVPTEESGLPNYTLKDLRRVYSDVVEIIEPPRGGYQLTLRINFSKLPQREERCVSIIKDISSLQAVILCSQLKEILQYLGSKGNLDRMYKPIKLVYQPGEPFFVIKMPEKITTIFPMRFKDDSDVIIATSLFQELMEVRSSGACAKAPPCNWSPIPPPELRGESFDDLSTNGGFVSFDIFSRHSQGSKLDKTVWNLLNFHAFVKYHVKCTKGFIQRRMRKKLESLTEVLQNATMNGDENIKQKAQGCKGVKKLERFSNSKMLRRKCSVLAKKIKGIRSPIKINRFRGFRRRWWKLLKFRSLTGYTKLD